MTIWRFITIGVVVAASAHVNGDEILFLVGETTSRMQIAGPTDSVSTPKSVVTYVEERTGTVPLGSNRHNWQLDVHEFPIGSAQPTNKVVWIVPYTGATQITGGPSPIAFLVTDKEWVRLNSDESLPYLDSLLCFDANAEVSNDRIDLFLKSLAYLFTGHNATPLTAGFKERNDVDSGAKFDGLSLWVKGNRVAEEAYLRSVCGESVKRSGEHITINACMITRQGAVQKWTISGLQKEVLHLKSVKIEEMRPRGTFEYAVYGNIY